MTAGFAYDDVPYDTEASEDTHPASIATLARLAGLEPASPRTARVLEIGCGNGANLLAGATYLPHARWVGFDLSGAAIASGIEAARAVNAANVALEAADVREVRAARRHAGGAFDYVVAHGMFAWVPEPVREDLLHVMREAMAAHGLGFLSTHALPGGGLRRDLRELARDRTRSLDDPPAKVAAALALVAEVARAGEGKDGHFGALAAEARTYLDHVARATPPEAPFARYVFHDLLAECNDAFTLAELEARLGAAGLRLVSTTPPVAGEEERARLPFLQLVVQRDDAPIRALPLAPEHARALLFWADLAPAGPGAYRTSAGALVRPTEGSALARAARAAPGFVPVGDDEAFARQLFAGLCDGVFTMRTEAPPCTTALPARPRVADYVRHRATRSAIVTSALHKSYRLPKDELAVIRLLDGAHTVAEIAALTGVDPGDVARGVDRLRRHLFLLEEP